jgi:hypothetical protein
MRKDKHTNNSCSSAGTPLHWQHLYCYNWYSHCRPTVSLTATSSFEVEVKLRLTVSQPVCPGIRRPSGTRDQFFFLLEISFRQLRLCYFVAPSLTRGWACNLLVRLLLGLARAVTLGSKSRRTHGHILPSHLRLRQHGGPGSRIYIPQEQGGPVIPPGTEFPFLSPLMTRRDYGGGILSHYEAEVTVRPTISWPVCLGVRRPSGNRDEWESELIYDRQSVGQSVLVSGAYLGPVTNFSFSLKFLLDIYVFVIL